MYYVLSLAWLRERIHPLPPPSLSLSLSPSLSLNLNVTLTSSFFLRRAKINARSSAASTEGDLAHGLG